MINDVILIRSEQRAWAGMRAYMLAEDVDRHDIPAQYEVRYGSAGFGHKAWLFIVTFYNPFHPHFKQRYHSSLVKTERITNTLLTEGMKVVEKLINEHIKKYNDELIIKLELPLPARPDSYTDADMADIIGAII